jgi:hypothetical protein
MCVDPDILARVKQDIRLLDEAVDEAAANSSPHGLEELRSAADKLMRSLAGVLIELGQARDSP